MCKNMFDQLCNSQLRMFSIFLLILLSLNLNGQSVQNRSWEYTKVVYTPSANHKTIITNSLPKGGGVVYHKGKEYNYFIFWTNIRNESAFPLELKIKFPAVNSFNAKESHFTVAFTKAEMTFNKVQAFDYGLTDIPSLVNVESSQVKNINLRILPYKDYLFYSAVFIHKTKWPVRTEYVVKDKKLFYKIKAGTDSVFVPCGGIDFLISK